jgi:hypothetical protein
MDDQWDVGSGSRAESRRAWPVRKYRLGEEPSDDLSGSTTPAQRLEMMWPLALEAWALTGRPLPDYSRDQTPVRRFRRRLPEQM